MSAASNYLELKVLDHVLRYGNGSLNAGTGAGYSPPATVYVALFAGTAGTVLTALESGTNAATSTNWGYHEINNASYARQSITFAAASAGSSASNATVSFPVASADYNNAATSGATVTCMALVDNSNAGQGNVLFYGQLTNAKTVNSGDQFTISSGNLTVSLA